MTEGEEKLDFLRESERKFKNYFSKLSHDDRKNICMIPGKRKSKELRCQHEDTL